MINEKKEFFDCELVEWPLICRDLYQHRWMGGPDATSDRWKQSSSAVRVSGGYPGNGNCQAFLWRNTNNELLPVYHRQLCDCYLQPQILRCECLGDNKWFLISLKSEFVTQIWVRHSNLREKHSWSFPSNFLEFRVKMAKMTLKVKVNDLHFQYQPRISHDACLVQIWWFQPERPRGKKGKPSQSSRAACTLKFCGHKGLLFWRGFYNPGVGPGSEVILTSRFVLPDH